MLLTSYEGLRPGGVVTAKVIGTEGVDLVAEPMAGLTGCTEEAGR